ncbi:ATP-binding protein [Streptomyces sp. NPDC087917]|uniref:sensor histidine kinase n=1 Tax=Streptomyces sp. NPDC087917 TaxID=3155060 RepID=UPI00342470BC
MTAPTPGWDAVIGPGFTRALQEGLSRATVASRAPRPPAVVAPALPAPRASGPAPAPAPGSAARAARSGPGPDLGREVIRLPSRAAAGALTPQAEIDAVLCRFEAALPAALPPSARSDRALRRALSEQARATLAEALGVPSRPAGRSGPAPAPVRLGAVAVSLLMECAVLQMSDTGSLTGATVRALGQSLREAAADTEAAARTGAGAAEADCCWHEQRWFSRELHDQVAVGITTARLLLAECPAGPTHGPTHGDDPHHEPGTGHDAEPGTDHDHDPGHATADEPRRFRQALRILGEADARLRSLVFGAHEEQELPPLERALLSFAETAAPAGVRVSVKVTGDEGLLPEAHRRDVFLTLREALRNSFAHSRARKVQVAVRTTRRWAYARVEDDGVGFDPERELRAGHGHQGLRSMAERVEDIGGRLTLRSSPSGGTLVEAHLPLQPVAGLHPPVRPRRRVPA